MNLKSHDKPFYCYSIKLYHYLSLNDFRYVSKGTHPKTKKNYWTYKRTDKFLEALTFFSNNKQQK